LQKIHSNKLNESSLQGYKDAVQIDQKGRARRDQMIPIAEIFEEIFVIQSFHVKHINQRTIQAKPWSKIVIDWIS